MTKKIKNIIEALPVAVISFDENFIVEYFNQTVRLLPEFFDVKHLREATQLEEIFPEIKNYAENLSNLRKLEPFEIQLNNYEKLNGRPLSVLVKATPIDENGKFAGGVIVVEDFTSYEEISGIETLETSIFGSLMRELGYGFAITDNEANVYYKSKSFFEPAIEFLKENFGELLRKNLTTRLNGNFVEMQLFALPDLPVKRNLYFYAVKDVTEQRKQVEAINERLDLFEKIISETQSYFVYDKHGVIKKVAYDKKTKYLFEEYGAIGNITEIVKGIDKNDLFRDGFVGYFSLAAKEDKHYLKARVFSKGEDFILTTVDISEDLDKLYKLTDIFENFELFLNYSNNFVWTAERKNGRYRRIYYTPNVEKIIGYAPQELIETDLLWFRIIHPNDRKKVVGKLNEALKNKKIDFTEFEYRAVKKNHSLIWLAEKIQILRDANGEVVKLIGSVADITKTKEEEEKIHRENEKLKEINQAKDRFISIISHDMRSPFSSILGFTKLLLEKNPSEKQAREYIEYIQNSAESMLNLVNALLDWTRLQTGRISFAPSKTKLTEIVRSATQMLMGSAIQKGINIEADVTEDIFVHADKNLLMQVFGNLIGNAIKFTKAGDYIKVIARKQSDGKFVEVRVKDSGVGIRKEDLNKLFKVDEKFTNPGTAGEKGTGLGLSLVYEIVKKHGGEIRVESEYGKGTEFIFTLPVSSSVVLLIDGNSAELVLYSKLVKSLFPEFKIENAAKLDEAEKIIAEKNPMLIISEIEAADFSIFDLIEKFKAENKKVLPAIIVLTRKLSEKDKIKLEKAGIKKAFEKPVDLSLFRAAISEAVR